MCATHETLPGLSHSPDHQAHSLLFDPSSEQTPADPTQKTPPPLQGDAQISWRSKFGDRRQASARPKDDKGKKTRKKLWEMEEKMRCPIIGTCLEASELRKLTRKVSNKDPGDLTDYEIHVAFVSSCDKRNPLSHQAHKYLEKKFAAHIRRFNQIKDPTALAEQWREALETGDIPGSFWALLTHPQCDKSLVTQAFQEIHMLSHQVGAGQRIDLQRLDRARAKLKSLQTEFDALHERSRKQLDAREQRIHGLEKDRDEWRDRSGRLDHENQALRQRIATLENDVRPDDVERLQRTLERQARELATLRQEREVMNQALSEAETQILALEKAEHAAGLEREAMERLLNQSLTACGSCDAYSEYDAPDLGGRAVLCLGGRNQLMRHYRELVSRCNGQFDYYDGGVEDNRHRLKTQLSAADIVFCVTDCVSHDAFYRMKQFCKRYGKPYVLMNSSGLSSFAKALSHAATGQVTH